VGRREKGTPNTERERGPRRGKRREMIRGRKGRGDGRRKYIPVVRLSIEAQVASQ